MPSIRSDEICNGHLYLLMSLAADETKPSVYRFDMTTGARKLLKGQGEITELVRYHDGHLLLLEKTSDLQWKIMDHDVATEACSPLLNSDTLNISSENVLGLLYDSWRDRVLLQVDKELLSFISDTAYERVAYLPSIWSDRRTVGKDGLLLLLKDESIYALSTLQKKQASKPLQVACNDPEDRIDQGFAQSHPNIVVKYRQVYGHEAIALFAEQMALRSDEIDIFEVPIGNATRSAIEKGYYYPLNQSGVIVEKFDAYRPFFQQAATKGDDIVGIPRMAEQLTLAYSQYALDQLGLTDADMPSGFMELMDFLLAWNDRFGDADREVEITPFGNGLTNTQLKAVFMNMMMDQYYALMEKDETAIPIYEEELANLLDKLTLVCSSIPEGNEEAPYTDNNERFQHIRMNDQPSYLFSINGTFLPGRRNFSNGETISDFIPIMLTLPSQDAPILLFEGTLFIVNPYSSQKEEALQWLAAYMDRLPASEAATFDQAAAPVVSETYKAMSE